MFSPAGRIGRKNYLQTGVVLMALKYAVDAALIYYWAGITWTPWDYGLSLASLSGTKAARFPGELALALYLWMLPFIWSGLMLSVRRARDAGLPLWLVVLFFVPGANYVLMATLAAWPTASVIHVLPPPPPSSAPRSRRTSDALGIAAGVAAGLITVTAGTLFFKAYGLSVFLGVPFLAGMFSAFVTRRFEPGLGIPPVAVFGTGGVLLGALLVFALEGFVCILMALPLTVPVLVLGGIVGTLMAEMGERPTALFVAILAVCGGQAVDATVAKAPERTVLTALEIAAPPEVVWRHVVSFTDISAPPAWYFRLGLSYPLRARIEGRGVGAVRYCEFTTGAFREPITAWDEPRRLAFAVTDQPSPLREWSPYRQVYAPHLDGFFRTTQGEFRLIALPTGGTRLEGRTWYSLRMEPQGYWTVIADAILHRIHDRVLTHIKQNAEKDLRPQAH